MVLTNNDLNNLCELAITAAKKAGDLIEQHANKTIKVQHKSGGSSHASQVVTEVDLLSEGVIKEILMPSCVRYDLALLTEESEDDKQRLQKDYFWCVDPMDGTLAFIESSPGYSVSIALVSNSGTPVIGVVYDPLKHTLYAAIKGQGALRNGKAWVLESKERSLTHVFDRSFMEKSAYPQIKQALKLIAEKRGLNGLLSKELNGAVLNACWVLEHSPGCYFKFPKNEQGGGSVWDYAATAIIFIEMGAIVSDLFSQPLELNRVDSTFMNHRGVMFASDISLSLDIQKIYQELRR